MHGNSKDNRSHPNRELTNSQPFPTVENDYESFDSIEAELLLGASISDMQTALGEPPPIVLPGDLVGGFYRVVEEIGCGGMGRVLRAEHELFGRPVALKIVRSEMAALPRYQQSFRREVQSIAALAHPGIVRVFDYGVIPSQENTPGSPWYAMEYAPIGSLRGWNASGPHPWSSVRRVLEDILGSLAHAHARGIVHRDLKPDNVLLREHPTTTTFECVLSDFGLAHPARILDQNHTQHDLIAFAGTPAYMSPEQFKGQWRDFGPWTDLYALGCMAWELCTGKPPFSGYAIEALAQRHQTEPRPDFHAHIDVPDALHGWLLRLLSIDHHARPERAADALWELQNLETTTQSARQLPTSWARAPHPSQHHSSASVGLGLFGLREVPFIGREPLRDRIWSLLKEVQATQTLHGLVIQGPSGSGKSRLVEWMTERAHEVGATSLFTTFHSPVMGAAGDGLSRATAAFMGCMGLSRDRTLERINTQLAQPRFSDLAVDDAIALTEIIAPYAEHHGDAPRLQFESTRERHVVIRRLLEAEARRKPIIVWIDDAQWGADALVFADLIARNPELPILMLLTVRQETLDSVPHEARLLEQLLENTNVKAHQLAPLNHDERSHLITGLLDLTPDLAQSASNVVGSSPLYIIQLVSDWVERGLLSWTSEGFTADAPPSLPTTTAELWQQRLNALLNEIQPDQLNDAMTALQLAAALGQQIAPHEWEVSSAQAGLERATHGFLNTLVEAMIVRRLARRLPDEEGWGFVHGKVREALQEIAIQTGTWTTLNRACADMIATLHPTPTPVQQERRALHLLQSGHESLEEALEPLLEVAKHYITIDNNERGRSLLKRYDATVEQLGIDEGDARRGQTAPHYLLILFHEEKYNRANALLDTEQARAQRNNWTELQSVLHAKRGEALRETGELHKAIEAYNSALEFQERCTPPSLEQRAHILHNLARLLYDLGRMKQAKHRAIEALETAQKCNDHDGIAWSIWVQSCLELSSSQPDKARDTCLRAKMIFDKHGNRRGSAHCINSIAEIDRLQDRHEEALAGYQHTIDLCYAVGLPPSTHLLFYMNIVLVWLRQERFDEARAKLDELMPQLESAQRLSALASARCALLVCAAAKNDTKTFDTTLKQIQTWHSETNAKDHDMAITLEQTGELWLQAGDIDRGRQALMFAHEQWAGLGSHERAAQLQQNLQDLDTQH